MIHISIHKPKGRAYYWMVAAALWLLVIWGHSLAPSQQSDQESQEVFQFLLPLFQALRLSGISHGLVRKLAHMTEFAVMGFLLTNAIKLCVGSQEKKRYGTGAVFAWTLCAFAALLDETIQLFIPGRSGEITDVWIDSAGAFLGCFTAWAIDSICTKLFRKTIH